MDLPKFESDFLSEVMVAIGKRRKALKHATFGIHVQKVIELQGPLERERLELTLTGPGRSASLRLFVWPNRWVWVDAREGSASGWKWEWTVEGRLIGGGRDLAEATERAYALSPFFGDKPYREEIVSLWQPLLASGPTRIVE